MTLSARINTPVEQHRRECTKSSVFHCKTVRASRLSSCSHICHTRHTQIQRECKAVKADRNATACNNAAVRCSVLVRRKNAECQKKMQATKCTDTTACCDRTNQLLCNQHSHAGTDMQSSCGCKPPGHHDPKLVCRTCPWHHGRQ